MTASLSALDGFILYWVGVAAGFAAGLLTMWRIQRGDFGKDES